MVESQMFIAPQSFEVTTMFRKQGGKRASCGCLAFLLARMGEITCLAPPLISFSSGNSARGVSILIRTTPKHN